MSALSEGWRRGQHGWPERFPVVQLPNAPLIVALAGWLVDKVSGGTPYARGVFLAGLAAWAWEELTDGVNWLRRTVGAAGLAYAVVSIGSALKG